MESPGEVDKLAKFLTERAQMEEYKRVIFQNKYAWWLRKSLHDSVNNIGCELLFAIVEKDQMKKADNFVVAPVRPFGATPCECEELYVTIDFESALLLYCATLGRDSRQLLENDNWCSEFLNPSPSDQVGDVPCKILRRHIRQVHFDSKKLNTRWCLDMEGFKFLMDALNFDDKFESAFGFKIDQFVSTMFNGYHESHCMTWCQPPTTYLKKAVTLKKIRERFCKLRCFFLCVTEMHPEWPPTEVIEFMAAPPPSGKVVRGLTFVYDDFKYDVKKQAVSVTPQSTPQLAGKRKLPESIIQCTQNSTKRLRAGHVLSKETNGAQASVDETSSIADISKQQQRPHETAALVENARPVQLNLSDSGESNAGPLVQLSRNSLSNSGTDASTPTPERPHFAPLTVAETARCLQILSTDGRIEHAKTGKMQVLPSEDIIYLESVGAQPIIPSVIVEYLCRTGSMPREVAGYYHRRFAFRGDGV